MIHACSTPTLNFSAHPFAHSEEQCPYLTPCRKYMHVIIQGICTFPKWHQSRPLWIWAELIILDRTNAITVKASVNWIRKRIEICFLSFWFFFFFLRISSSWDEKKTLVISEWIHLSVFFSVNNATCRLHGCIGWVRHLWPSGDWELVFACRESRSKQARDRPRWSELDSACWARRQILSL